MENKAFDRRTFMRGAAVTAGVVAFGSTLAACAPTDGGASAGAHIDLWGWAPPELSKLPSCYEAAADRWIADGEGRSFKYVLTENAQYNAKFRTALLSGKPPQIATINADVVGAMVESGQISDITDVISKLPKLNQKMVDRYSIDGKAYTYWPDVQAEAVIYNKTIFDELGLEVPTTLDDLIKLAAPIRAAGYEPLCVGLAETWIGADMWFQGLAYSDPTDGMLAQAEAGEIKWTADGFLEAGKYLEKIAASDLLISGYSSLGGVDGYQVFGTGKAAMIYPGAVWSYGAVADIANGSFEMGVFELPPIDGGQKPRAIGSPSSMFIFPAEAENQAAAFELLGYMADPEGQASIAEAGYIPGVAGTPPPANPPFDLFPEFLRIQEDAASRVIFVPEVMTALTEAVSGLWSGTTSAQDVVDAMQAAAG